MFGRVYSVRPRNSFQSPFKKQFILERLVLFAFSAIFLCLRLLSNPILPHFSRRWDYLIVFSEEAEARSTEYPLHLWQAVVAYEDRRFFWHCGIDSVGIARAVLSFSARGGGSTITQQIYWGHGIYGIESASVFYFGKQVSLLSLGESALLAGIIPAPELQSLLRDPSRKIISHFSKREDFQARVLKRMVEVGFLDIETALLVVKQSLHLCVDGPKRADALSFSEQIRRAIKVRRGGSRFSH